MTTKKQKHNHREIKPYKVNIEPYNPDGYEVKQETKKTL